MIVEDQYWTTLVFAVEPAHYPDLVLTVCPVLNELKQVKSYHFKIQSIQSFPPENKTYLMVAFRVYCADPTHHKSIHHAINALNLEDWVKGFRINPARDKLWNDGWLGRIKGYAGKWPGNFHWRIENLAACSQLVFSGFEAEATSHEQRGNIAHLFANMLALREQPVTQFYYGDLMK